MDLSGMSIAELRALETQIKVEMSRRESQKVDDARAKILAIVKDIGIPLAELMNGKPAKPKAKVAIKFRHPSNSELTWTGRGRAPRWVKELRDAGDQPVTV